MDHGIGINKVGRNNKINAVCDEKGRPHVLLLTPGNTHDAKVAMLAINAVPPSEYLVADKGYDSNALRTWLTRFGRNIKTFMATIAIAAFVTWRL